MELVRSFMAIEIPPQVRAELAAFAQKLKAGRHTFVKWVGPESVHLTLKFLGNVPLETVPRIVEASTRKIEPLPRFSLQMGGTGAFPDWQRPQVIWVGLRGEIVRLAALQKDLEAALSPLGFPPDSRAFSPHLTVGRLRDQVSSDDKRRFGQWAQTLELEGTPSFEVVALSLMRSQLTRNGPIYSKLATIELKGIAKTRS